MKDLIERRLEELSGSYTGAMIRLTPAERKAMILGAELATISAKTGNDDRDGVFIQEKDLGKINRHVLAMFKSRLEHGAFDFSTDEFIPHGIRGVVK